MSNKQSKRKNTFSFDGFDGINGISDNKDKLSASSIVNYRIRRDGSLQKRHGFRPLTVLTSSPRAVHSCMMEGKSQLFVLIDDTVYIYDFDKKSLKDICQIESSYGNAYFFQYQGSLFLVDGVYLYQYSDDNFLPTIGYVPLVGKNWPSNTVGEINEPRNVLNNHARITYIADKEPSYLFCFDAQVESIDAVYLNSNLLEEDKYTFVSESNKLMIINGLSVGAHLEIFFTYKDKYRDLCKKLLNVDCSAFFGGYRNNILLSGGYNSSIVFCSRETTAEGVEKGEKHYSMTSDVYFPLSYATNIGNGINKVKSISNYYDKILIFTEGDVWMLSPNKEKMDDLFLTCVSSELGCMSSWGVASLNNDAVSVSRNAIWRWSHSSDAQSNCKATNISEPIEGLLRLYDMSATGAYYNQSENELWIYNRYSNSIFIYNLDSSAWYTYSDIIVDTMLTIDGKISYIDENIIYQYDPEINYDLDEELISHPISASFTSNILDFDSDTYKNICDVVLRADLMGNNLSVSVTTDNKNTIRGEINGNIREKHSIVKKRLPSKKFKYASVKLSTSSSQSQVIYGIKIAIR